MDFECLLRRARGLGTSKHCHITTHEKPELFYAWIIAPVDTTVLDREA